MTVFATIVVLGVLIFVHELGHFWAAKAVDIKVDRFAIGLGPRVAGFKRGETEYILAAIPLGGYVKMAGMADEVMEKIEGGPSEEDGHDGAEAARDQRRADPRDHAAAAGARRRPGPRDFDGKPIWARTIVISAGVIMNFLFAFLAYGFVAGFFGEAELDTRRVGNVAAERLPPGAEALVDLPVGADLVQIGERPIERWRDVTEALRAEPTGPLTIRTANPSATVRIDLPADIEARRQLAGSIVYWVPAEVGAVTPGTPAEEAGLRAGDAVVAVEGTPVTTWEDLVMAVRGRMGLRTELELRRDEQSLVRVLVPEEAEETDPVTGETITVGRIGILRPLDPVVYERVGLGEAVVIAWDKTVLVTRLILGFLRDLLTGNVSPRSVGSIVAIGEMSGDAAEQGFAPFLEFMALFSINLAILNLLPIPILDGGHLVFLLIEGVRGKAVSIEQRARWSQVGLVILLGIMILALSNDFQRVLRRWF